MIGSMSKKQIKYLIALSSGVFLTLILAVTFAYVFLLKEVNFIPVVRFDTIKENLDKKDSLVTTRAYYSFLKKKYPRIIKVEENEWQGYLQKGYVAILPWWYADYKYKTLKINGVSFYEDDNGFIKANILSKSVPEFDRSKITRIAAGGTVVLARGIAATIDSKNNPYLPWYGTKDFMSDADFSIVNFKSPLVYKYKKPASRWHLYGKSSYVAGLVYAGVDLVSVSGNHMGDAGKQGLLDTIDILKKVSINSVGAGINKEKAYEPYIWKKDDVTFAFLAFNSVVSSIVKAKDKGNTVKSTGIAWLDDDALVAVNEAKKKADIVIAIVNWGKEYIPKPTDKEIEWGRKLVDAGADIILGDQAHWVQNYEFYKNKFISYGLGNYVFDQYWSEKTREGILEKLIFYGKILFAVEVEPIKLKKYGEINIVKNKKLKSAILNQFYGK
jgi:poly-gamma-glutamate capsule biosynthesis protein CapA/YwtB (metallophosphatase superfamily)